MNRQEQRFSTGLLTVLTMAGLAIGLGNVWRFPYMMGAHGGSAFLFIYLLFMLLLAVPALAAEWSLGRATRAAPVAAFRAALGPRAGLAIGVLMMISVLVVLVYYSVIVGNVLYSAWFATHTGFSAASLDGYQAGLDRSGLQYLFSAGLMALSLWVVSRGLRRGIEAANRLLIPLFAVMSAYLVFVSLSLDGALAHVAQFLQPDFSQAGPRVWFAAMGQACFSVGLSGTVCVMYGAYLREHQSILPTATATGMLDLGAALLGALFVVPAVLVVGLDMAAGPGLLFDTLPHLFSMMPGGRWLAPLFLVSWAMVAMLTIFSVLDTIAAGLADLGGPSRGQWMHITGVSAILAMAPVAWNPQWIGVLDLVFGSGMFMVGALVAVLALGWGLGAAVTRAQLSIGLSASLAGFLAAWIRWVVPAALAAILAGFLINTLLG